MYLRATLIALISLVAAATSAANESIEPTQPKDPFYKPDEGWERKHPGQILKWRKFKAKDSFTKLPLAESYELLYRTTENAQDDPQYAVTTVLVPKNARKDVVAVLSQATDANNYKCTASYLYESNGMAFENRLFLPFLYEGYISTVPNNEGPKQAFGAGRLEGHMTLDSLRATLNFAEKLNINQDAKLIGYGYSGGALAMSWASSLHHSYAPELNVLGWAYGGTPTNLSGTLEHAMGTLFSGFVVSGLTGVSDAYPYVQKYTNQTMTSDGLQAMHYARENCVNDVLEKYPFTNLDSPKYAKNGKQFFFESAPQKVFKELTLGTNHLKKPTAPVFMYHAEHDEVIPFGDAQKTADAWCKFGSTIKFMKYSDFAMQHITTEYTGALSAFNWLKDRIDGKYLPKGCQFSSAANPFVDAQPSKKFEEILDYFVEEVGLGDIIYKAKLLKKIGKPTNTRIDLEREKAREVLKRVGTKRTHLVRRLQ